MLNRSPETGKEHIFLAGIRQNARYILLQKKSIYVWLKQFLYHEKKVERNIRLNLNHFIQDKRLDQSRLILVEGLPGSGKSTLAKKIADELKHSGKKVICFDEGDANHPADYENYDFKDFPTERDMILKKWKSFVNQADPASVYVFNCIFLQNPLCETMMRFDLSDDEIFAYIQEITEIIAPMNPSIIYIDQPSCAGSVDQVLPERGNEWLQAVIDYHVNQGYGKRNHLHGYEGYLACLEERKRKEKKILKQLPVDSILVRREGDMYILLEE